MTTITAQGLLDDDRFERAEKQLEWVERLEALRGRRDRENARLAAVSYVEALRDAVQQLAGHQNYAALAQQHGAAVADLVDAVRNAHANDEWHGALKPALLDES